VLLEEKIRLALFAGSVLAVHLAALTFVIHAVAGRLQRARGKAPPPLGPGLRRIRAASFALVVIGAGCFLYARLIEPFWPEVSRVRVESARLPPGSRPIRLVHITDVHSDPEARLEGRIPDLVAAEKPDLIVFTGDSINSPGGVANFRALMTRLDRIAPTYAVRGNWDVWSWGDIDLFGGTGVTELSGKAERVPIARPGGPEVWVSGVEPGAEHQIAPTLALVPPGALSIFLHHYPDEIAAVAAAGADLYCAGHTHGGQIALPFYGALVTLSRFGKRYEAGLYREGQTALHVSRGIGMEGGAAPRVRFFARPEIAVIELVPKPGPEARSPR
jgi:predicted MPP superfamily phosphohydrolase